MDVLCFDTIPHRFLLHDVAEQSNIPERQDKRMDVEQAKHILGITDLDDGRTAKIKYRRLIGRYHPDVTGSAPEKQQELAQKINAAYSLLKSEEFFLKKAASETLWRATINEAAFAERNIYAPYHMDIDADDLYQTMTRGKYMWNPDEEEFHLFLRSIYHVARDILDAIETECGVPANTDSLRLSIQEQLFHCLAMQFVEPAECLSKIARPDIVDSKGRSIYRFRAYIGEKQNLEMIKRIASLQIGETVYPTSLRNSRLMIANKNGETLGHLSFAEDELYYCLYPFMSAHLAQIKLTVRNVQASKERYSRHAKAGIEFLIRLEKAADNYRNPDMNSRIKEIVTKYRNLLQETA